MRSALIWIALVSAWGLIGHYRLVSPLYLPDLGDIAAQLDLDLLWNASVSLIRTVVGFLAGILLAYVVHASCFFFGIDKQFDAQSSGARAIPIVATLPLFLLWFGFSEWGRLLVIMLTAIPYYVAPLQGAFQNLPREWTILQDSIPLSRLRYYVFVAIPGTIGELTGSLRVTFGLCFTIAIAADYVGAENGIGKYIDAARVTFNIPALFAAIFAASAIGIACDKIIRVAIARFVHWGAITDKS